ncbi:MAG TPA: AAA family ATPase [Myxococcaceae bacterium]|nr:AAA family ATPase [Myxococcaceae bacterium]
MSDPALDARAFQSFLEAQRAAFLEREAVLEQLALALLAREHVLLTGPPGTAKSALAHSVLGGIVEDDGKASLFTRQLTEGAVQTDLLGPVDFKVLTETGRTRHILEEGMLGHRYAFLDEIFDGRDMLLRAVLNALHERELKQGASVERGLLETAVLTSNRFLSEVVARVPELLLAFADRIAFRAFVPSNFARAGSRRALLQGALRARTPTVEVTLPRSALARLQAQLPEVQVPPEVLDALERLVDALQPALAADASGEPSTRLFSQRTLVRAVWALRAAVVRDGCRRDRPLRASPDDLGALSLFFATAGPEGAELEAAIDHTADAREQAQLSTVRHEQRSFAEALRRALAETRAAADAEARALELPTLTAETERLAAGGTPVVVLTRAAPLLGALRERLTRSIRAEHRSALVGLAGQVVRTLEPLLRGELDEAHLRRAAELPPLLEAPELAADRARLAERVRQAGAATRVRFIEEARAFAGAPPASVEAVGQALEPLARWSATLSPDDAEASGGREAAAQAASEALQLLLTGAGAVPGDAAGFARLRAALDRAADRIHRLHPGLDLAPVARALALGHVAALGADEPLLPALERLEAAELLSDEVRAALAAVARARPRAVASVPGVEVAEALSGEAYRRYRSGLDGAETDAARVLRRLGEEPGGAETLDDVAARLTYLRRWYDALHAALASHGPPAGGPETEQRLASLVSSRFPALVLKESEFAKLDAELQAATSGPASRRAQDLRAELAALADGFGTFSRALLARRA